KDPSANRKGFATLSMQLEQGTPVQFFLEIPTLDVDVPLREACWEGRTVHVVYTTHVASSVRRGKCPGTLHLIVRGVPVGEIAFELHIEEQEIAREPTALFAFANVLKKSDRPNRAADAVATKALRFRSAFVSYSRKDVQQVLLYAEALDEGGIRLL